MCCYNSCCCTNYMCSSATLTDRTGSFYYPCDGLKRLIFLSTIPRPTTQLTVTNTGNTTITVELSINTAGTITPKIYNVESGKSLLMTDTNVSHVYVMGVAAIGSPTCSCNNYYNNCGYYHRCSCNNSCEYYNSCNYYNRSYCGNNCGWGYGCGYDCGCSNINYDCYNGVSGNYSIAD